MKKIIHILMAVCVLLAAVSGCGEENPRTDNPSDPHIVAVKGMKYAGHPGMTFGDAFKAAFENPKWEYFKGYDSDKNEADVVEFTGKYMVLVAEEVYAASDIRIQFVDTFDGHGYSIRNYVRNGKNMTADDLAAFLEEVFQKAEQHYAPDETDAPTEPEPPTEPETDAPGGPGGESQPLPGVCVGGDYWLDDSGENFLRISLVSTDGVDDGTFMFYYGGEESTLCGTLWAEEDGLYYSMSALDNDVYKFLFYTYAGDLYAYVEHNGEYACTGRYVSAKTFNGTPYSSMDLSQWNGTWFEPSGSVTMTLEADETGALRLFCVLTWLDTNFEEADYITPGVRSELKTNIENYPDHTVLTVNLESEDAITVRFQDSSMDKLVTLYRY